MKVQGTGKTPAEENLNSLQLQLQRTNIELEELNAVLEEEIAEKQNLANHLQKYADEIEDLYDNAPCGYHSVDKEGRFIRINATELAWLGYSAEELLGKSIRVIMTVPTQEKFQKNYPVFMEKGFLKGLEMDFIRKDGSIMPVEINATAIKDEKGNFLSSRTSVVDIHDRKIAEEQMHQLNLHLEKMVQERTFELQEMYAEVEEANAALETEVSAHITAEKEMQRARDEAEAANNAKSQFLANMSHEIRTPLNGIIGMTDLTLSTTLDEEQQYYLSLVKKSSLSLHQIINDILDYSRIEAGMLQIHNSPMDIWQIIEDVMAMFDATLTQKELANHVKISPEIPRMLVGDALRVKQVLSNLIGNAVKFTQRGSIDLDVHAVNTSATSLQLVFYIKDTGIGIPPTMHDKIFDRFIQVDSSYKKQFQGTGLGLAISKKLVELMGGELCVEQNPGGGSIFCFTSPFMKNMPDHTAEPEEKSKNLRSAESQQSSFKKILLVEDDPINHQFLSLLLRKHHYEILTACTGSEALSILETEQPDLILMDIQMPEMDGARATEIIRTDDRFASRQMPIIAMTAYAMKGDRERFIAMGFDDYISKPVDMHDVMLTVEKWLAPNAMILSS